MTGEEDVELLRAWQAGDGTAGRSLIRRHDAPVYRFFFTKVDASACEDLTQATFEVRSIGAKIPAHLGERK